MTRRALVVLGAVGCLLVGPMAAPSFADDPPPPPGPCGTATAPAPTQLKVAVVMMENESPGDVYGNGNAPYINSLASQCGSYTNVNVISRTSGTADKAALTSGVAKGESGKVPTLRVASIFSQLGPGMWSVQAESMPGTCIRTSSGLYAAAHNPAVFYPDVATQCQTQNVADLTAPLANFTWVVPNLLHSGHQMSSGPNRSTAGRLTSADAFLANEIPLLTNSPDYLAGNLVIFVLWDQPTAGSRVPCLVLSPYTAAGQVDATRYNDYSLLATIEDTLGLGRLGGAVTAVSGMGSLF